MFQHQDEHTIDPGNMTSQKALDTEPKSVLACITHSTVYMYFLSWVSVLCIAALQALLCCHVSGTAVFIPAEELRLYSSIYCWPLLRLTSVLFLLIMFEAVGSVSHPHL